MTAGTWLTDNTPEAIQVVMAANATSACNIIIVPKGPNASKVTITIYVVKWT
jgi:hypothetical protein